MKTKQTYISTVEEDTNGDLLITIPPELLQKLDWNEGDNLNIKITVENTIILQKVK